jgi:uncharacterized protein YjbI with pentapeptide repeats/uncharacterized membrane protein
MLWLLVVGTSCVLTVLNTPDKDLIIAEPTVKVPLAGTSISLFGFIVIASFLLILLTMHLHLIYEYWLTIERTRQKSTSRTAGGDVLQPAPVLFGWHDPISRALAAAIFYCATPIVFLLITWKACGVVGYGRPLALLSSLVTIGLVSVWIRRTPEDRKGRRVLWRLLMAIVGLTLIGQIVPGSLQRSLNLVNADLSHTDLRGLYLAGANLRKATLADAQLRGANLEGASLWGARVTGDFRGVNLSHADLQFADLRKSLLVEANLRGANLLGAQLEDAHLDGATLAKANLQSATLQNAVLFTADLAQTDLRRASLEKASLEGADLKGANLEEADLRAVNFQGASLEGADLRGANLQGARNLTGTQLAVAILDQTTKLPRYINPKGLQVQPVPRKPTGRTME